MWFISCIGLLKVSVYEIFRYDCITLYVSNYQVDSVIFTWYSFANGKYPSAGNLNITALFEQSRKNEIYLWQSCFQRVGGGKEKNPIKKITCFSKKK